MFGAVELINKKSRICKLTFREIGKLSDTSQKAPRRQRATPFCTAKQCKKECGTFLKFELVLKRMKAIFRELSQARQVLKEKGVKALFKRYGWKLVLGIFAYYIIRDVTLYVILPALMMRSFLN